jgi:dienelactone hydrolase
MMPQMMEFARRGWAAVTVMRRGYGTSGGGWAESYGSCAAPDYAAAGRAAAADLRAAIAALSDRPDIDTSRTLAVGVSAGGFAVMALSADPPRGLRAAISFAGGRGSTSADSGCDAPALIAAFRAFGATSRLPMLWVFADNDHFFGPQLAAELQHAFEEGGGRVDFRHLPAFGSDGHTLFSAAGRPLWTPVVDRFLEQTGLAASERISPPPAPSNLTPPPQLGAAGRKEFQAYLEAPAHKAFAVSARGGYGWRTARRSNGAARADALAACEAAGHTACSLYAVDDGYVAH